MADLGAKKRGPSLFHRYPLSSLLSLLFSALPFLLPVPSIHFLFPTRSTFSIPSFHIPLYLFPLLFSQPFPSFLCIGFSFQLLNLYIKCSIGLFVNFAKLVVLKIWIYLKLVPKILSKNQIIQIYVNHLDLFGYLICLREGRRRSSTISRDKTLDKR